MTGDDRGADGGWSRLDDGPEGDDGSDEGDGLSRKYLLAIVIVLVAGLLLTAVVLTAVATTFVLGIGTSPQTTPAADVDFERDAANDSVRITHTGGDTFDEENTGELFVVADGRRLTDVSLPFLAGDEVVVTVTEPGTTVRVVWSSPDDRKTEVIARYELPA